jgi:exodeoxyribonuclease VII small subunit
MEKAKEELSFEEAMNRLEAVVEQLESGEVPLEKAIALFQEGMELSRVCNRKLTDVEQKIEMLLEKDGCLTPTPFELEGNQD